MMNERVIWQEEYSTGVREIDNQHKDLFDFMNKLDDCIENGTFHGPQIQSLIGFLTAYTKSHFIYEEMCMRTRICPAKEKNEKAHQNFIDYYMRFVEEYQYTDTPDIKLIELSDFLKKWMIDHICKIDVHLKNCIYKK